MRKISHCGSHSPKYVELSQFTLLICRGRQRNVQRLKTLNLLFDDALVAVAVPHIVTPGPDNLSRSYLFRFTISTVHLF